MSVRVSVLIAVPVAFTVFITRAWQLAGEEPPALARIGSLAALAAIAAWAYFFQSRTKARPGMLALYWVVLAFLVIAVLRAARIGTYESWGIGFAHIATLLLVGLIGMFAVAGGTASRASTILLGVCCAPIVAVTIAAALYLTGLAPALPSTVEGNPPAAVLGYVGIAAERIRFPLSSSINSFGSLAGAGLVAAIVLVLRAQGPVRLVAGVGLVTCSYVLLRTDSRGAVLFALVSILVVVLIPRSLKRGMSVLPLLMPLAPIALLLILGLVADTQLGGVLAREGTDLGTATNRSEVWSTIADRFVEDPSVNDVIGYGYFGHAQSGISAQYADVLAGAQYADRATAHNFVLQQALDVGYIGVAFILVLIAVAWYSLFRAQSVTRNPAVLALSAMLVYFTLAGVTDPTPSLYYDDSMVLWLLIIAAAMRPDLAALSAPELERGLPAPKYQAVPSPRAWEPRPEPQLASSRREHQDD